MKPGEVLEEIEPVRVVDTVEWSILIPFMIFIAGLVFCALLVGKLVGDPAPSSGKNKQVRIEPKKES